VNLHRRSTFFFVFSEPQRETVLSIIDQLNIKKFRIFMGDGLTLKEDYKKINFKHINNIIMSSKDIITYIPQINSIFSNMIFSNKNIVLANIPDGMPNFLPSPIGLLQRIKLIFKKMYCGVVYRKNFTLTKFDLSGFNCDRYYFAFTCYPDLILDKKLLTVKINPPWNFNTSAKSEFLYREGAIIGQPIEELIGIKGKIVLLQALIGKLNDLGLCKSFTYFVHPREKINLGQFPANLKLRVSNTSVENIFSQENFLLCAGFSSYALLNIKNISPFTKVYFHLCENFPGSKDIKNLFIRAGLESLE